MHLKYTKEVLLEAVIGSISVAEVVRKLNPTNNSSSLNSHIRSRLDLFGIDTSHFLGQGHLKGKSSSNKRKSSEFLVEGKITAGFRLRRALVESGVPYKCKLCGIDPEWNGKPLTIQVDHINGIKTDNRKKNLRFLCPNCHSQTDNYAGKGCKK